MTRQNDIYKVAVLIIPALLALQCARAPRQAPETKTQQPVGWKDSRGFDPLELPQDSEIIPAKYPHTDPLRGQQSLVEADRSALTADSVVYQPPDSATVGDTLNNQAYRVQLLSSRVFTEARDGARVAEEIFDQPVFLDYEVPNYKVRVGNFANRRAAEDYMQRVRAAGYANAWVVVVNLHVHETAPLYDTLLNGPGVPPTEAPDTTVVKDDGE